MVRGGYHFAAGISIDGSLFTWGSNENGALANGNLVSTKVPTIIGNDSNWKFLAVGHGHGLAVKTDGTLWAWGLNDNYQLGDGTTTKRLAPVQIGTDTDWKEVAAGSAHSMAVKIDGSVWTWGASNIGQTGHGSTTNFTVPTQVMASSQFICDLSTVGNLQIAGENVQIYESPTALYPLSAGTPLVDKNLYYATQTVNGCETQKRLSIFVLNDDSGIPAPTGNQAQSFCPGAQVSDLTAAGSGLEWYDSPTGGSVLSITTLLTNNSHYYATQGIGSCVSSARLDVLAQIETGTENPPTGSTTQRLCTGSILEDLVLNEPNIKWFDALSGGSELPVTTILTDGHYFAAVTSSNCQSSRLEVAVSLVLADPPTVETQVLCHNATVQDLTLNGIDLRYYYELASSEPMNPADELIARYYFVSQTVENCESERVSFYVQFSDPPPPGGEAIQSWEAGKTLGELEVFGENVSWYGSMENIGDASKKLDLSTLLEENQTYYATQTLNACEGLSALAVTVTTPNVTGVPSESVLQAYPNPVIDYFFISSDRTLRQVSVSSVLGNEVVMKEVNDTKVQIDLSTLQCGTYFVNLQFNDGIKVIKIYKQ